MLKLSKGIYGIETNPKNTPFGLLNYQIRHDGLVSSAGWFNGRGEKLGSGDLTIKDLGRISKTILRTELFLVLTESDARWDIPKDLDSSQPGIDYVIDNCIWVIGTGKILRVRDGAIEKAERDGIAYKRIPREELYKLLGYKKKSLDLSAKPEEKEKTISTHEMMHKLHNAMTKAKTLATTKSKTKPILIGTTKSVPKQTAPVTSPSPPTTTSVPIKKAPIPILLPKKKLLKKP